MAFEVGFNASTWPQLKHCVIFPLRDKENKIVSFYGRSIYNNGDKKPYYTADRKGLYPRWPNANTQVLILTEAVIDAATLLQDSGLTPIAIGTNYSILSCYGTNGFTKEHEQAISEFKHLQEVILFFDGDEAGRKAVQAVAEKLHKIKPEVKISYVDTPENEDVNSLIQSHEVAIFKHLIDNRKKLFFSSEASEKKSEALKSSTNKNTSTHTHLNTSNPHNLIYKTENEIVADVFAMQAPGLVPAWLGLLAYTVQIYFDFSGYSDMAVGLGLLFGFRFPQNFSSPYKAVSITDFWRRWHITLSTWLRDYLYIPLGGNRVGDLVTYRNLFLTFLIGGIWHGAGGTFVFWGALHGTAMVVHRAWEMLGLRMNRILAWFITFNFVNIASVFFRAKTWDDAMKVLKGMLGYNGIMLSKSWSDLRDKRRHV